MQKKASFLRKVLLRKLSFRASAAAMEDTDGPELEDEHAQRDGEEEEDSELLVLDPGHVSLVQLVS